MIRAALGLAGLAALAAAAASGDAAAADQRRTCEDLAPAGWVVRGEQLSCAEVLELPHYRLSAGGPCRAAAFRDSCAETCGLCPSPAPLLRQAGGGSDGDSVPLVVFSDVHVEPWYDVDGSGRVARFADPTVDNMWQCRDSDGAQTACLLNGESDAPVEMLEAAMGAARRLTDASAERGALFYTGDTDAHDLESDLLLPAMEATMDRLLGQMLATWRPEDVFFAGGNNDGEHNLLFCDGSHDLWNVSLAWGQKLLDAGIVTDEADFWYEPDADDDDAPALSQTEFFMETGYYLKQLTAGAFASAEPPVYVIVLNTNLEECRHKTLKKALHNDLALLKDEGALAYVIGHHPDVVQDLVPDKYLDKVVLGTLAGHEHEYASTDKHGFTLNPPLTQIGDTQGFWLGDLPVDGALKLKAGDNLVVYTSSGAPPQAEDFQLKE